MSTKVTLLGGPADGYELPNPGTQKVIVPELDGDGFLYEREAESDDFMFAGRYIPPPIKPNDESTRLLQRARQIIAEDRLSDGACRPYCTRCALTDAESELAEDDGDDYWDRILYGPTIRFYSGCTLLAQAGDRAGVKDKEEALLFVDRALAGEVVES